MADTSDESKGIQSSSAATAEKNDTQPAKKSSPATSDSASYIVDVTEKHLGRAIIITGAPGPKR